MLPVLIFLIFIRAEGLGTSRGRQLELQTFQLEDGWGYQIFCDNKLFIYQPTIPAIDTVIPFPDKESAHKIGSLVLKRLKANQSPAICLSDIDFVPGNL